jgi:uncharacterized protein (UPF0261 family)
MHVLLFATRETKGREACWLKRQLVASGVKPHCGDVQRDTLNNHINDPEFAGAAARALIELMQPE